MTGKTRPPGPAVAVIAAIVTGLAVWGFLRSAYFAIDQVRVVGVRHLPADEVTTLADVPVGDNLIMLSLDAVERRVEEHVWIHDAVVRRDLPSTVVIAIIERRPAGWITDAEGVGLVAGDGTLLERRAAPPETLPEIGVSATTVRVGERVDVSEDPLRAAAGMPRPILREVRAVETSAGELTLVLRDGGTVLYGSATNLPAKNRALGELLRWARSESVEIHTIDVRVPSAPSLQPAGASRPTPVPTPSRG